MKYKYDVFLSFSGKDNDFVRPIWKTLKNSGLKVFISDETQIERIGLPFIDGINEGLETSKDFLLICTPNSMAAKWVKREHEAFYSEFYSDIGEIRRLIILEGKGFVKSLLPPLYRNLQRTNKLTKIIRILKNEEEQSNDQEMMTTEKKIDWTEYEVKNTLYQIMKSHMVKIPGDKVLLKDNWSENQFTAEISSFYIDKFPVTQVLYERVMGEEKNKSHFKHSAHPVENVTWSDAIEFCNRLSDKTGLKRVYTEGEMVTADWSATGFRLPTEAEWRYACQARTKGERYGEINKIAWYIRNSNGSTQRVGNKEPNQFGLYDMLGNVYEWCWDLSGHYPNVDKKDWRGPESGSHRFTPNRRITPGGAWNSTAEKCTFDLRNHGYPDTSKEWLGFRLARSL